MKNIFLVFTIFCMLYTAFAVENIVDDFNSQQKMNQIEEKKVEQSPIFQKPALFYYHKFLNEHKQVNPKIPLKKHYENERKFRVEKEKIDEKINKIKRKIRYQKRDSEHTKLKILNQIIKTKEDLQVTNKMDNQKETDVKFEINHNIMWKKYYEERRQINRSK